MTPLATAAPGREGAWVEQVVRALTVLRDATTDENQTALDATWYGSNNAQFALTLGDGWIQFSAGTPAFLVQ